MAIVEVKVPQLSESVAEATMLTWKKKAGEAVAVDEILIEIETDKVVLEVPAPAAGVLAEIVQGDGATVVAGCGGGQDIAGTLPALLSRAGRLVLDADALNQLCGEDEALRTAAKAGRQLILTPHPGEAARLLGESVAQVQSDRVRSARELCRRTGAELGPAAATEQSRGDIMVRLRARGERKRPSEEVIADLRERIGASCPEARIEFVQVLQDVLNDLAGDPRPIEIKLFGPDYHTLDESGEKLAGQLEGIKGLVDLYAGHEREVPELRFAMRRDPLARLRAHLVHRGLIDEALDADLEQTLNAEIAAAIAEVEPLPPPARETLFDDVYAELPWHLSDQRDALRKGPRARGH